MNQHALDMDVTPGHTAILDRPARPSSILGVHGIPTSSGWIHPEASRKQVFQLLSELRGFS